MLVFACTSVNEHGDEEESGRCNNFFLSRIKAKVKERMSRRDRS